MGIFEYAMKMELDGEKYYREHADKMETPELKGILQELARDEQKHYNIFKALHDGTQVKQEDKSPSKILQGVRNIFETIKTEGENFSFAAGVRDIWVKALEIEQRSEAFYREKIDEVKDEKQREILSLIAAEEHKHWVAIDNVINFIDRPGQWLEDAEWGGIDG